MRIFALFKTMSFTRPEAGFTARPAMLVLRALVAALLLPLATGVATDCVYSASGVAYDLSKLYSPTYQEATTSTGSRRYYFNVCGAVQLPAADAACAQINAKQAIALAVPSSAADQGLEKSCEAARDEQLIFGYKPGEGVWELVDPNDAAKGVKRTYQGPSGGDPCPTTGGARSTVFYFKCDKTAGQAPTVSEGSDGCTVQFTFNSVDACLTTPGGSSSGSGGGGGGATINGDGGGHISAGWVLVLLIVVGIFVYLAGGVAIKVRPVALVHTRARPLNFRTCLFVSLLACLYVLWACRPVVHLLTNLLPLGCCCCSFSSSLAVADDAVRHVRRGEHPAHRLLAQVPVARPGRLLLRVHESLGAGGARDPPLSPDPDRRGRRGGRCCRWARPGRSWSWIWSGSWRSWRNWRSWRRSIVVFRRRPAACFGGGNKRAVGPRRERR